MGRKRGIKKIDIQESLDGVNPKQVTSVEVVCLNCDVIFMSSDLNKRGVSVYRLCKKCRKRTS